MACVTNIAEAWVAPGFCAYDLPVDISQARGILSVGTTDLLAIERGSESVVYLHDTDDDGLADAKHVVAQASSLNHGIAVHDGYLYASNENFVYRWKLPASTAEQDDGVNTTTATSKSSYSFLSPVGEEEIVIDNISADASGELPNMYHLTRTLAFDTLGRLYVSVGSIDNVDPDGFRARIRRFDWGNNNTSIFPLDFLDGEVLANGVRNEVGLAFDKHGDLWGVENSADMLVRDDIGGEITEDNPAEELNPFKEEDSGKDWGYPMCWTEFKVPEPYGMGAGTIWAWPSFFESGDVTDEWCRANTVHPVLPLQGHSAPLGIRFYEWKPPKERPDSCPPNVAFPQEMDGYAFIAYHGSWNRGVPTGYKVVFVEMNENGDPAGNSPVDLLMHEPPNAQWNDGFRPVDVDFDDCGRLLISSDGTRDDYRGSKIVRMEFTGASAPGTLAPSQSSTVVETQAATILGDTSSIVVNVYVNQASRNEKTTVPTSDGDDAKELPLDDSPTKAPHQEAKVDSTSLTINELMDDGDGIIQNISAVSSFRRALELTVLVGIFCTVFG